MRVWQLRTLVRFLRARMCWWWREIVARSIPYLVCSMHDDACLCVCERERERVCVCVCVLVWRCVDSCGWLWRDQSPTKYVVCMLMRLWERERERVIDGVFHINIHTHTLLRRCCHLCMYVRMSIYAYLHIYVYTDIYTHMFRICMTCLLSPIHCYCHLCVTVAETYLSTHHSRVLFTYTYTHTHMYIYIHIRRWQ